MVLYGVLQKSTKIGVKMKIAIITDLHFGVRKDDPFFLEKQKEWWVNQFMETVKSENIKTVIHLGDLLDNRRYTNSNTLFELNKLMSMLDDEGIYLYNIIGNHDTYYKNTNRVNTPQLFFPQYQHIVDDIEFVRIGKYDFYLVPWLTEENQDRILTKLDKIDEATRAKTYLLGHFEIAGINVNGRIMEHGLEQSLFFGWKKVLSGHYHAPSITNNIHYIGNPFYHTWNDYGADKGFYIYNSEDDEFNHIETSDVVYHIFTLDELKEINTDDYKNQIIRIKVDNLKDNQKILNPILEKLNENNNRTEIVDISSLKNDVDLSMLAVDDKYEAIELSSKDFMTDMVNEVGVDEDIKDDVIEALHNLIP